MAVLDFFLIRDGWYKSKNGTDSFQNFTNKTWHEKEVLHVYVLACVLPKDGNPIRPVHYIRSLVSNCIQVCMFHSWKLQKFLLIAWVVPPPALPASLKAIQPMLSNTISCGAGKYHHQCRTFKKPTMLKQMKARICVCGTKIHIFHLKSSYPRSLDTKKCVLSFPVGSRDYIWEGEFQTLKGQVSLVLSFQNSSRKIRAGEGLFPSEKLVPKLRKLQWQTKLLDKIHSALLTQPSTKYQS